ncbi:RHS repeat-associated core domain-containing protein [Ekhidna lutea]|uniref:RHS repeat-associated core domain-containing protein n=1 Tax=Ekhidna lutea TaxID=447679 RepID=A0A239K9B8_EKHLU|nr:RHS repeat-associated core domain-containing protein [Ekhidna lutea]SNT14262.1 RHS repeat-associated core domain-containing protein [Ekhidna lutea]
MKNLTNLLRTVLFILSIGLFSYINAQNADGVTLTTFVDGVSVVCGDAIPIDLEVEVTSGNPIDQIVISLQLPPGVLYTPSSAIGMVENDISDLNNPIFSVSEAVTDLHNIQYFVESNCSLIDYIQSNFENPENGFVVVQTNISYRQDGITKSNDEPGGSESISVTYAELQLDVDTEDHQRDGVTLFDVVERKFSVRNTGLGSTDRILITLERVSSLDSEKLFLLDGSDQVVREITPSSSDVEFLEYELAASDFPSTGIQNEFELNESLRFKWDVRVIGCSSPITSRVSADWGCEDERCNVTTETFFEPIINVDSEGSPDVVGSYVIDQFGSFCGDDALVVNATYTNNGVGSPDPAINTLYNIKIKSSDNIVSASLAGTNLDGFIDSEGNIDLADQLTSDPDGAGGIEDIDGDSFYDDFIEGTSNFIFTYVSPTVNDIKSSDGDANFHMLELRGQNYCDVQSPIIGPADYTYVYAKDSSRNFSTGTAYSYTIPDNIVEDGYAFQATIPIVRSLYLESFNCSNPVLYTEFVLPADVIATGVEVKPDASSDYEDITFSTSGQTVIVEIPTSFSGGVIDAPQSFRIALRDQTCEVQATFTTLNVKSYVSCDPSCTTNRYLLANRNYEYRITGCPSCSDGIANGDEEGIDCGGSCPEVCDDPGDGGGGSGTCSLEFSSIKLERTTFGWVPDPSNYSYGSGSPYRYNNPYLYKDLFIDKTIPKVTKDTPGVRIDRGYAGDTLKLTAEILIQKNVSLDNIQEITYSHSPISYSFFSFIEQKSYSGQVRGLKFVAYSNVIIDGVVYPINTISEPVIGDLSSEVSITTQLNLVDNGIPTTLTQGQSLIIEAELVLIDEIFPIEPDNEKFTEGVNHLIDDFSIVLNNINECENISTTEFSYLRPRIFFTNSNGYNSPFCEYENPMISEFAVGGLRWNNNIREPDFPNEFRPLYYIKDFQADFPTDIEWEPEVIEPGSLGGREIFIETNVDANGEDFYRIRAPFDPTTSIVYGQNDYLSNVKNIPEYNLTPDCSSTDQVGLPNFGRLTGEHGVGLLSYIDDPSLHLSTSINISRTIINPNLNGSFVQGEQIKEAIDDPVEYPVEFCSSSSFKQPNNWFMAVELPQNTNLKIIGVKDENGDFLPDNFFGPIEDAVQHPNGKNYLVQVGYLPRNTCKQYTIVTDYFDCDEDALEEFKVVYGFSCDTQYPNVDQTTETVADLIRCDIPLKEEVFSQRIRLSNLQIIVDKLGDRRTELCQPVEFEALVASTRYNDVSDLKIFAELPEGVIYDNTYTPQYLYPALGPNASSTYQDVPSSAFFSNGDQIGWDMTEVIGPILPGSYDPNNNVKIRFRLSNTCDFNPGIPIEFYIEGVTNCGGLAQLKEQRKMFIEGFEFDEFQSTISADEFTSCSPISTISLTVDNLLETSSMTDELIVTLPSNVTYQSTTPASGLAEPTVANQGGVQTLTYSIPPDYVPASGSTEIGIVVLLSNPSAVSGPLLGNVEMIQNGQATCVVDAQTCPLIATTLLSSFEIPANLSESIPTISTNGRTEYCIGETISSVITASMSADHVSYQWFLDGTSISGVIVYSSGDPDPQITADAAGQYTIRAISESNCTYESDALSITINDGVINVDAGADQLICANTLTLSATGDHVDALWQLINSPGGGSANIVNADQNVTEVILTEGVFGTYEFRFTGSDDCVSNSDNVIISYNNYSISGDLTCANTDYTLTANITPDAAGFTYQWYSESSGLISGATSATFNPEDRTDTYRVEASNGNCLLDFEFNVDAHIFPVISTTDETEYCPSSSINNTFVLADDPGYVSYEWLKDGTPFPPNNNSDIFTATESGTFSVRVTTDKGCTYVSNEIEVSIISESVTANAGQDQLICDATTTLSASGTGFVTGEWSVHSVPDGIDPINVTVGNPNDENTTVDLPVAGTYEFLWQTFGNCPDDYNAQDIVLVEYDTDYFADVSGIATVGSYDEENNVATICPGTTVNLTAQLLHPSKPELTGGLTYRWSKDGTEVHVGKVYATSEVGTYEVEIAGLGCARTTTVQVIENNFADAETITVDGGDPTFCPGDTRILRIPDNFTYYQWRRNGSNISSANSASFTASQPGSYSVMLRDDTNCEDIVAAIDLSHKEFITIAISDVEGITCPGATDGTATIRLTGSNSGTPIDFEVLSSTNMVVFSGTVNNNTFEDLPAIFGQGTYTVSATHPETNCVTTDEFEVIDGSPFASIQVSSISCGATVASGESALVQFTLNRLFPQDGGSFNFRIIGVDDGLEYLTGTGDFGELVTTDGSGSDLILDYTQAAYELQILEDASTANECDKSFIINLENERARITTSAPYQINSEGARVTNDFVVCGEGQTAEIFIDASMLVTNITPGDFSQFDILIEQIDVIDGTRTSYINETNLTSPITIDAEGGFYEATITSSNPDYVSCTRSGIAFNIQQTDLDASIQTTNVSCPGGDNGRASALASGGVPPYRYSWLNDSGSEISTLSSVFGLTAGDYVLEVFDSRCGDPYVIPYTITEPDPLGDVAITQFPTNLSCDVVATLSNAGGTPPYRFEWIRLEQTTEVQYTVNEFGEPVYEEVPGPVVEEVMFVDRNIQATAGEAISMTTSNEAKPGTYKIRVVDANGCFIEGPIQEVEQPEVTREYHIAFRWKTFAEEVEPEEPITVSTASIASKSMGGAVRQAAEICVENNVAVLNDEFEAYCRTGELLEDEVTLSYNIHQYHYTLYYYDRAGNLTRTIPPKGVDFLEPGDFGGSMDRSLTPAHSLVTQYDYDNWRQLTRQESPDGGETYFAYNNQGQLRFSQNEKQLNENHFSYTKYDRLGRVAEVGQAEIGGGATSFGDLTDETLLDQDRNNLPIDDQFPTAAETLTEQTRTFYSEASGEVYYGEEQTHLRNRVSYARITNEDGKVATTHYSYDPHGNVKWLVQDIPDLNKNYIGYEYDLISGNVKQVNFNQGAASPFFHRYSYDEDNRILSVLTSNNGYIWEEDARYDYFNHGPLKRMELGKDKVQGVDYAYTIHGWLKGINHGSLDPSIDPGQDGNGASTVARDAFGMELGYYEGDFTNENSIFDTGSSYHLAAKPGKELFNGNISTWTNNILSPTTALTYSDLTGYQFEYDELNRIKTSELLPFTGSAWSSTEDYSSAYTYDPNGNLMSLTRQAYGDTPAERAMDELTYNYDPANNQLTSVDDAVASSPWLSDVEDQEAGNYTYDEIGNLVADTQSDITDIDWTVYGKVNQITHANGDVVNFHYDAAGNRIRKQFAKADGTIKDTYYVRDAGGNIMAVYEGDGAETALRELPIYGSDRIGQFRPSIQMVVMVDGTEDVIFNDGTSYLIDEPTDVVILGPGFTVTEGETFYAGPDPNDVPPESQAAPAPADATHVRVTNRKQYELKDHLGNVRGVVSDKKLADVDFGTGTFSNIRPEVMHASFFYPFGMELPGMNYNSRNYRYGFNGKEKDQSGEWGSITNYDYGFRIYNPGIGKFLSEDPLTKSYPELTPYQFASNSPIDGIDLDGLEYLSKDEARVSIVNGTAFIRLETFSDVFKSRFRQKFPYYGLVYQDENGFGYGQGMISQVLSVEYLPDRKEASFGRPSDIILWDRPSKSNYRKYSEPNVIRMVPVTKSGETDKRFSQRNYQELVSHPSPAKGRGGASFIFILNTANFIMETNLSMTIRDDLDKLSLQVRDRQKIDDVWAWRPKLITTPSPLNLALRDVQDAMSIQGFIPEKFMNTRDLSAIINIVLFGGEGNESEELKSVGNKVIEEISNKQEDEK